MAGLREVLAELDVEVKGLGDVDAASAELDRYLSAASPVVSQMEELRVKQQEAGELAGRLARKIRELQNAEGDHSAQISELRVAMVRARDAAAEYGAEAEKLRVTETGLAKTTGGGGGQDVLGAMRGAAAQIGLVIAAAAGLRRAFGAVVETIEEVIQLGGDIDDTSQRLGISARALQEWQFIAERADVSTEALERSFATLGRNAEAGRGPWRELGISVREANGELRSQEELFGDAIQSLSGVGNATRQAALAQELFGRSGTELLTLIRQSPDDIDVLRMRFEELGAGLSDDVVANSAAADDAMADFELAMRSFRAVLVADVLPGITQLTHGFATLVGGFSELVRNSSLVEAVLGTLAVAAGVLAIALLPVIGPPLLIAGGLALLVLAVEDVITAFRGGDSVFGSFVEWIFEAMGITISFKDSVDMATRAVEDLSLEVYQAVRDFGGGLGNLFSGDSAMETEDGEMVAAGSRTNRVAPKLAGFVEAVGARGAPGQGEVARTRPGDGGGGKTINAPVTITINGATDTEATRRVVRAELARSNRELGDTIAMAEEPEPA